MNHLVHMCNKLVQNFTREILVFEIRRMCFIHEIEDSGMKINFICEVFILHMELKPFMYEIPFAWIRVQPGFIMLGGTK